MLPNADKTYLLNISPSSEPTPVTLILKNSQLIEKVKQSKIAFCIWKMALIIIGKTV